MRLLWVLLVLSAPASAANINSLVIFGDSLSDDGNAAFIFQAFPALIPPGTPAPVAPFYTAGRYTDGPDSTPSTSIQGVWVEQLAARLGVAHPDPAIPHALVPLLPNGTDFAIAGAQTGSGPSDMGTQVAAFLGENSAGVPADALYILFGGANDLYNAANPMLASVTALANIEGEIAVLYASGARNFLFPNLPDLGQTPRGAGSAALSAASLNFELGWAAFIAGERAGGVNVTGVDLYSRYRQIQANPAAVGLTNVTTPAQGQAVNPDKYLFWDVQHPTTVGHQLISNAAFDALSVSSQAVPEPASVLLSAAGLGVLLVTLRRKLV